MDQDEHDSNRDPGETRGGGIVASAGSCGDDQENAARDYRAGDLRNNVSGNIFRFKFAAEKQTERHSRIDMASGYRSDCVSHDEERKPEGKRDASEADVAAGEDSGAAAAEDEYESAYQFRCISFHTVLLLRRHWGAD